MKPLILAVVSAGVLAATTTAHAQRLKAPQASPEATVTQTVGLTEIKVDYHRPAVAGRAIWGQLVPYNEVWRAGANENTIVSFSSDVKIGGKAVRAGRYGLHMLPTAKDWTVILSNVSTAWGSYTYDAKEDAVRVVVKPRALAAPEERLIYRFDEPSETRATLVMAWDKLAVPVVIEVDTPKVVMASMRGELRGLPGFNWEGWNEAAGFWLRNGGPLDEALKLADRSIGMRPTYANLSTRAAILDKQGNAAAAKQAREKAQPLATEQDLNAQGYQLLGEKKLDDAIAVFRTVTTRFPDSWNAQDSLGEALVAKGDKPGAIAAYEKAGALVKDATQKKRIEATIAKLKAP